MSETGMQLIAAVRVIAAVQPDKVYEPPVLTGGGTSNCVNVFNGKGSCIVGCAALATGIITAEYEHRADNNSGVYTMNHALSDPMDADELSWLSTVQLEQDTGKTWGDAVVTADSLFPQGSVD